MPNRQVFQVFIRHIRVVSVLGIGEDLLLLFFEIRDQIVKLFLSFAQQFLIFKYFQISVSELWIYIFEGVSNWVIGTKCTRFL